MLFLRYFHVDHSSTISLALSRFVIVSIVLIFPNFGAADEKTLTANEIKQLLSGNTEVGRWVDHDYRQYFSNDGSTIYAQKNSRSSIGRWRVNSQTDHYESWWEQSGWGSGYSIVLIEKVYYWVSSTGTTEPQAFSVVSGQRLVFDE